MQFKEKLMSYTWENLKKPKFRRAFGLFRQNCSLSTSHNTVLQIIILWNLKKN